MRGEARASIAARWLLLFAGGAALVVLVFVYLEELSAISSVKVPVLQKPRGLHAASNLAFSIRDVSSSAITAASSPEKLTRMPPSVSADPQARVHVLTFADRRNIYLDILAAVLNEIS